MNHIIWGISFGYNDKWIFSIYIENPQNLTDDLWRRVLPAMHHQSTSQKERKLMVKKDGLKTLQMAFQSEYSGFRKLYLQYFIK